MTLKIENRQSAIQIAGLVKQFEPAVLINNHGNAIDNISCDIERGKITGLVGPDGAGKTTLMRIMAGLLKPNSGDIKVEGFSPLSQGDALHDLVGYMPQKFGLYEGLTVMENLILYADLRNVKGQERKDKFERLLAFTDLARFTDRFAGKLSGGMKQKLGLACTMLGSPKVLLLDEASVGVDPISRRELWTMVRELIHDGITVIWSTSYIEEAQLCDNVILMSAGKIIANDKPQALMQLMQDRCWQITDIEGNRREILQKAVRAPEVLDAVIQGSNIRLVLKKASIKPDLSSMNAGKTAKFIAIEPRLEDTFISLLGAEPVGESRLASVMPVIHATARLELAVESLSLVDSNSESEAESELPTVSEARNLTKVFGDFTATNDISFKVKRGEIFGLLGPNGAGKSTTFKMKCGLLKPTSGQALVMGYDLKRSPSKARQKLGYMAQKFSLYAQLTVAQNLQFFSGIYGLKGQKQRDKIAQLVDVFALEPYLTVVTGELALGFKQRLALACAVMHEPQVLFLDEPTSGVDPITRREFWTHINGLANKGVSIMVTTHFMDEAEYCDRIGLVYRGTMIALGTPDELKQMVATDLMPNPTMEDAFIQLVQGSNV